MSYQHLSPMERYHISLLLKAGLRPREIARLLNRHPSTIYRELKHVNDAGHYTAHRAQQQADERAQPSRNARQISPSLWNQVRDRLYLQHSPEQIAGCLPISHESIYQRIYADRVQGGQWYKQLRQGHKKRRKRYAQTGLCRPMTDRRNIAQRPAHVEKRARVGHWEIDTIVGPGHRQAIVSAVERKSGYVCLRKVSHNSAEQVSQALVDMLKPYKVRVLTLTSDNGKEFALHKQVDQALGCISYFADPYSPWQRGSNENTNGLVRQYIPKKQAIDEFCDQEIANIEYLLNHRPRKRLGFQTPHQVFTKSFNSVALRT